MEAGRDVTASSDEMVIQL